MPIKLGTCVFGHKPGRNIQRLGSSITVVIANDMVTTMACLSVALKMKARWLKRISESLKKFEFTEKTTAQVKIGYLFINSKLSSDL